MKVCFLLIFGEKTVKNLQKILAKYSFVVYTSLCCDIEC